MIFVVSLPIPNVTVLGIFLAGKYWTVFIPCHPISWLLSQQEGLMSCASESSVLPSNISSWGWIYHQEDVWDPKSHIFALLYQKWLFTKQGNCSHPTHTTKTKITFQNELSTASKPWAGFEPGFWKRRVKKKEKTDAAWRKTEASCLSFRARWFAMKYYCFKTHHCIIQWCFQTIGLTHLFSHRDQTVNLLG